MHHQDIFRCYAGWMEAYVCAPCNEDIYVERCGEDREAGEEKTRCKLSVTLSGTRTAAQMRQREAGTTFMNFLQGTQPGDTAITTGCPSRRGEDVKGHFRNFTSKVLLWVCCWRCFSRAGLRAISLPIPGCATVAPRRAMSCFQWKSVISTILAGSCTLYHF